MRQKKVSKKNHPDRWFIWTIVFLVVAGVSLTAYLLLSTNDDTDVIWLNHHPAKTAARHSAINK